MFQNSLPKKINIMYAFLVAICTLIVVISYVQSSYLSRFGNNDFSFVEPNTASYETDVYTYTFDMENLSTNEKFNEEKQSTSKYRLDNHTFVFYTKHQTVDIFEDGTLVYSLREANSIFGGTTGNVWNIYTPSNTCSTLEIRVKRIFPSLKMLDVSFLYGSGVSIYRYIILKSLPEITLSFIIFVIGFYLIMHWSFFSKHSRNNSYMLSFGIFSSILGLWTIFKSDFFLIVIDNPIFIYFGSYVILSLLPVPFILFVRNYFMVREKKFCNVLCMICQFNILLSLFLQITGLACYRETAFIPAILMVIEVIYLIYVTIKRLTTRKPDRRVYMNAYGLFSLAFGLSVTIVFYFFRFSHLMVLPVTCFLVYCAFLWYGVSMDNMDLQFEARRLEIYKELAIKDILTGLNNRNAYEQRMSNIIEKKNYGIVSFDLNYLKEVNDSHGHSSGDHYLTKAAMIIKQLFSPIGEVYRIGGDEFCVLIPHADEVNLPVYLYELHLREEEAGLIAGAFPIQIAAGYAIFDPNTDRNLEDTRDRADQQMYEDKKRLKALHPV